MAEMTMMIDLFGFILGLFFELDLCYCTLSVFIGQCSVDYSQSHCPVLLHVQLHFKLFSIGRMKTDGG